MTGFLKFCSILFLYFFIWTLSYGATLQFDLQGISGEVLKNVSTRLDVLKEAQDNLTENKIQTIYEQAPKNIEMAMQPYGYFHTSVEAHLSHHDSKWLASFVIHAGKKIKISELTIKVVGPGNQNAAIKEYLRHFPLKVGDTFRSDSYESAKENLFQITNNNGYVNATLTTNKVLVDVNHYQVKIILELQTGSQYYFGKISFQKNPYSTNFLNRFVNSYENTTFSSQKLLELQQALSNTTYFKQLTVTPNFNSATNNHVPITIVASAPKAKKYNLGIGYGTLTGPRFTAGASLRRLTDDGQHLDAQLKLSSVLSEVAAKYYIPGKNPLTDQWLVGVSTQRFLPKNGSSTSGLATLGYVTKSDSIQTSIDLNYLVEHYKVNDRRPERSHFLYPSFNILYSNSDDLISPTKGEAINLILRGASENISSSTNFFQAEIKGKYFYTPVDFMHLIFRADVGYTATNKLKNLPLSMRFFAGGINTIRGYKDSSIGPGKYLYVGSMEYQNRIKDNWWGAVFYDAGTATNRLDTKLSRGAGVGLIYQSYIGPIKVYLAQAVSKKDKPWSLELSIGPEF